jgi:hypothetical protein
VVRLSVCGTVGSKRRLLEMTVGAEMQSALAAEVVTLLQCAVCEARYCDPLRGIDYEAADPACSNIT